MALTKVTGQGLETLSDGVTITTADNTNQLTLVPTDGDGGEGPNLVFYRNSSSPADNDDLSTIDFIGRNDNSQDVTYGQIKAVLLDASDGTEDARLEFYRMIGGTSSPDLQLNSEGVVLNEGSDDRDFRVESNGNANMLFVDGGNDRVNIGSSSSTTVGGESGGLNIFGAGADSWFNLSRYVAGTGSANIQFGKSRNGTVGSHTIVQSGDSLGQIAFAGSDGNDFNNYAALIKAEVDGTPGNNDMPGRLVFSTTVDGANSPTERMRIHNGGVVSIPQGIALGVGTANTASNLLDDYEEGTWTPTLASDAQPSGYTTQVGYYRKIGSLVHIHATVQVSGLGSFAGAVINLNGLPFTVASLTSYREVGTLVIDGAANEKEHIYLVFSANGTNGALEQLSGSTNHDNNMNANAIDTNTIIHASGTYIAS